VQDLKAELKNVILTECNLIVQGVTADDITDSTILFGADAQLGLDSIDYLQICMVLSNHYRIKISVRDFKMSLVPIMRTIVTLTEYVSQHRGEI
jgi:acyl carrier protein